MNEELEHNRECRRRTKRAELAPCREFKPIESYMLEDSWQIPPEFLTLRAHPFAQDPSPQGMSVAEGCSAVMGASGMHQVIDRILGLIWRGGFAGG